MIRQHERLRPPAALALSWKRYMDASRRALRELRLLYKATRPPVSDVRVIRLVLQVVVALKRAGARGQALGLPHCGNTPYRP
jgi:hypothetical protein